MDPLSDAHYQAIGRILVARNDFLDHCATILLVAQFGIPGRSAALNGAFVGNSTCDMTERVAHYLDAVGAQVLRGKFVKVTRRHMELLVEIDRIVSGRWGLVDFTRPERPALYAKGASRAKLDCYGVRDLQDRLDRLRDINIALRPLMIESD